MSRVALVTGASRGLGEAVVRRLVGDGWRVVMVARNGARLSAIAAELSKAGVVAGRWCWLGDEAPAPPEQGEAIAGWIWPLDVTDAAATTRGLQALAIATGGDVPPFRLDAIVNAAGCSVRAELGDVQALAVWEQVLRVNLSGTYHVVQAAAPLLATGGRVVNFSSDLGKSGLAGYAAYCAAKHGVIGLTRALALELAPRGITVNAVCPGWVETDMAEQGFAEIARAVGVLPDDVRQNELSAVPLGRFATAADVADLVAYMLSSGAAMLTGTALDLNGGSLMG